ncbi:MAG TPA: flotillin-like FloA family protein [Prosthecobacter sp.]|nr:flotillin-like FloA family protein [Prosthecobacter sp.]
MPRSQDIPIFSGIVLVVALILFVQATTYFRLWLRARTSNAPVSILELLGMHLRGVPRALIVDSRISAAQAGIPLETLDLEAHHLSGGDVAQVIQALVAARKAGIPLTFSRACAIDLAGKGTSKTVLEAVRTSINSNVIDCPPADMGGGGKIDAAAADGIPLRVRARVTVRTNLDRFIGGATEETLIARVSEGIVACIASAATHTDVLDNPGGIAQCVLAKGVDTGTAFDILSIDLAEVVVDKNVSSKLKAA